MARTKQQAARRPPSASPAVGTAAGCLLEQSSSAASSGEQPPAAAGLQSPNDEGEQTDEEDIYHVERIISSKMVSQSNQFYSMRLLGL